MLLENKTAILYGGGNIGGTVAREGARVFLAGRTLDTLDAIASDIDSAGGQADTAQVDATDAKRVGAHFAAVADQTGGVDISLNMVEDRGQVLICAVARQLSTRTRGDDPSLGASGVYAGATSLSLMGFGRHRGLANSLHSCGFARLGTTSDDT